MEKSNVLEKSNAQSTLLDSKVHHLNRNKIFYIDKLIGKVSKLKENCFKAIYSVHEELKCTFGSSEFYVIHIFSAAKQWVELTYVSFFSCIGY